MCEKRLAVDDLVAHILQDGTFQIGRIPIQDTLGVHRKKIKCHDDREEDFPSDPLYREKILVKVYPNDGRPADLNTKNLTILDRNMKIGQLVKKKGTPTQVGYVSSITQTASGRIYEPNPVLRNDPFRELYMYKKPMTFFKETSKQSTLEVGDIVMLDGWIGPVEKIVMNVAIQVDFKNGTKQKAHIVQLELLLSMINTGVSSMDTGETSVCHFGINGPGGIFPGRAFDIPYKNLVEKESFKWGPSTVPKPADETTLVGVTVETVTLHMVTVDWRVRVDQNANTGKPATNIKNDITRARMTVVSHAKPLKVGDVRLCDMTNAVWLTVLGLHTWRSCLAKDYYLHKKRDKRPKLDEDAREILPDNRPAQVMVEIMTTASTVDVIWTDGRTEQGIDSRKLDPVRYTKYFPGAIIVAPTDETIPDNLRQFVGLGRDLRDPFAYQVVESSLIKEINFRDRSKWNTRSFSIAAGAVEPTALNTQEITAPKQEIPIFSFWKKDQTQVVVKRKNSAAQFTYGCVIGMFPDGRTRIRSSENGEIVEVWPTDLVAMNPMWLNASRNLFEGYKFYN